MSNELLSDQYKYIIDTSYGINQDGFIAIGTESIVYKGLKTKHDGVLQFSCVLKFKPKAVKVDGEVINRLSIFKNEEWKIFEELRECRSIVKIDDVVEDLGDFSLSCNKVPGGVINSYSYFCVVEEFIDGWNLDEFCREEYWKLRRTEPVGNGISKVVNFSEYSLSEKKAALDSYNYDNTLKYQSQILLFMINLCEILEFVTEQKNIIHLDIKPENIMVTRYGKELVLIDFGKSRKVTKANRFAASVLSDVDYSKGERVDKLFEHGTLGYAAPECYCKPVSGSRFPFSVGFEQKKMSLESDVFSFGVTFWECLNIFELVIKNKQFSEDAHDFYQDNFLNDDTYMRRDLSCTSIHYHKKLESIIKKCTNKRDPNFTDTNNKDYYHSYCELKKDIENTKASVPTIRKEENVNVRNAFNVCGVMISLLLVFLIIGGVYHIAAFNIASGKWDDLTATYNDTQFYRMEEIANDLIDTAVGNQIDSTYEKIAAFTYKGNDISEYEAAMLVELLQKVNNGSLIPQRVDEIMKNANTRRFKEISTSIIKLGTVDGSVGYELAQAIFNAEVGKTGIVEAYDTLQTYQDNKEFRNAVIKLKNILDNDASIKTIADNKGLTRQDIQNFLKTITEQEKVS